MTIITGDPHGDFSKLSNKNMKEDPDYVIITGDFGLIWTTEDKTEIRWKKWLADKKFEVIVCLGNHENFNRIYSLPIEQRYGNTVYKYSDNIYILQHGLKYVIEDKSYFVYGGATSIDKIRRVFKPSKIHTDYKIARVIKSYLETLEYNKHYYIDEQDNFYLKGSNVKYKLERKRNITWWKEEVPEYAYEKQARKTLEENNYTFDYVLTHTAPRDVITTLRYDKKVCPVSDVLQAFSEKIQCKKWFFGHLHTDKTCNVAGINYQCLYETKYIIKEDI